MFLNIETAQQTVIVFQPKNTEKNLNLQYLSTSRKKHDLPLPHRVSNKQNIYYFRNSNSNCKLPQPYNPHRVASNCFCCNLRLACLRCRDFQAEQFSIYHLANQIPKWPPLFGYSTRNFNPNCLSQFSNFFSTYQQC